MWPMETSVCSRKTKSMLLKGSTWELHTAFIFPVSAKRKDTPSVSIKNHGIPMHRLDASIHKDSQPPWPQNNEVPQLPAHPWKTARCLVFCSWSRCTGTGRSPYNMSRILQGMSSSTSTVQAGENQDDEEDPRPRNPESKAWDTAPATSSPPPALPPRVGLQKATLKEVLCQASRPWPHLPS